MIRFALIALLTLPAAAQAGNCYAPTYRATYYAPAYKYVVLYQIGVEQRVDAIARKAADEALRNYKPPQPTANVQGKFTVEFGASSEASGGGGGTTVFGGAQSTLQATEQACLTCHGGEATKGGGKSFTSFATLNKDGARAALRYVTKLGDGNCASKAGLSSEAQQELVEYLCKFINQ